MPYQRPGSPDRERFFIFSTIPNEFIESFRIHRIPDYADSGGDR